MWTLLPRLPFSDFLHFLLSLSNRSLWLDSLFKSNAISSRSALGLFLQPDSTFFFFFFYQARIPATINQSGDSPWMSVNMFPSLPPFPPYFSFHTPCWEIVVVGHQIFRAGCRLSQVESKSFGLILHIHVVIKPVERVWRGEAKLVYDIQAHLTFSQISYC